MAQHAVSPDVVRRFARWWEDSPERVRTLERDAFQNDPSLSRLAPSTIGSSRELAAYLDTFNLGTGDVLAYQAYADGNFGRFRVVAVFLGPPDVNPAVLCLDGPRGGDASPHRNGPLTLCLYYPRDPQERRWTESKGLEALFGLARQHLVAEDIWRTDGVWVLDEAPHGETVSVQHPGRNAPCTCGSGRKAKRCCWA